MNSARFRIIAGSLFYLSSLCLLRQFPLGAPFIGFGGLMIISGFDYFDFIRLLAAAVVVSIPDPRMKLAVLGLLLLDGSRGRLKSDEASIGWTLLLASRIVADSSRISNDMGALTGIFGVFLLAGIWPISWSWLRTDEPWGRRISRSLIGLYLLYDLVQRFYPLAFDTWAPLILFLPIIGIIWASGLLISGRCDAAPYRMLVSFETQLLAIFILSVRSIDESLFALAFWSLLLSIACIWSATRREGCYSRGMMTRLIGLGGVATILAVPILAGFPYRWLALSALLFSSPAGFAGFLIGMILLPLTLRPIQDQLRSATPGASLIAAILALGGSIFIGIVPGLVALSSEAVTIWSFLMRSVR